MKIHYVRAMPQRVPKILLHRIQLLSIFCSLKSEPLGHIPQRKRGPMLKRELSALVNCRIDVGSSNPSKIPLFVLKGVLLHF